MKSALIITLALVAGTAAQAELKITQKPVKVYLTKAKEQINAIEAFKRSTRGEDILECTPVQAECTDTGSCKLKKVK